MIESHTKHGALGHRLIVVLRDEDMFGLSDATMKAFAEHEARRHCAKLDRFPVRQLTSQAQRGRPSLVAQVSRWSVWVRVATRPATHPWNEERRLQGAGA